MYNIKKKSLVFAILNMFDVAVEKRHRGLEDVNSNLYDMK